MVTLFCRHNRFTADCPICSRGTVLDRREGRPRQSSSGGGGGNTERRSADAAGASARPSARGGRTVSFRGPYAFAGPYEREGVTYEVRLERVPGGLRLAEWAAGRLRASAPVLAVDDLTGVVARAGEAEVLAAAEHAELSGALEQAHSAGETAPAPGSLEAGESIHGASPGRSGELREELRVERLDSGRVRVARWVLRPGTGWELLEAPPMLPAHRYAEALRSAAQRGALGV